MLAHRAAGAPAPAARHPVVSLVEGITQRTLREITVTGPGVRLHAR